MSLVIFECDCMCVFYKKLRLAFDITDTPQRHQLECI